MMKKTIIPLCLFLLLTLSACRPQSGADVNEFLKILGTGNIISAEAESFRITKESERYRYSYAVNDSTMLCLYADKDGVIVQCTVTSFIKNSEYFNICAEITRTFTGRTADESRKLVKSAFDSPVVSDGYKLALIDSQAGFTFLVNHESDELNTNEYPTLKRHIDEKDISRPTAGRTEKSKLIN